MEYYSATKKEGNSVINDKVNEPGGHMLNKWNTSDRERQILCDLTYMGNLKKLFIKQKQNGGYGGAGLWSGSKEL